MANSSVILPLQNPKLTTRFRGFLPVVVDIETGGFNSAQHAILEIAMVTLRMDREGLLHRDQTYFHHIMPHPDTEMTPDSLAFTGIDPYHPFRFAVAETQALEDLFSTVQRHLEHAACKRAILVGHNAAFDLGFLQAAIMRGRLKNSPFHSFSMIDTASLSAVFFGQTVLARAVKAAGLFFDQDLAHSAIYDAEITADLFCQITNQSSYRQKFA